jgi:hypothetical protein
MNQMYVLLNVLGKLSHRQKRQGLCLGAKEVLFHACLLLERLSPKPGRLSLSRIKDSVSPLKLSATHRIALRHIKQDSSGLLSVAVCHPTPSLPFFGRR